MIPVIAKIEQVASVRAFAGNAEILRGALNANPSNGSADVAKHAASEVKPRRAPVTDNHGLRLTVDSNTHKVLATLVNTATNEVIRTIPGEETGRAGEVIRAIAGQLLDKIA